MASCSTVHSATPGGSLRGPTSLSSVSLPDRRLQVVRRRFRDIFSGVGGALLCGLLVTSVSAGFPSDAEAKRADKKAAGPKKRGPQKPPPSGPPVPLVELNLPTAAVRISCDVGASQELCDAALGAARTAASRRYALVSPGQLEAFFASEPSLRSCRNDSCRAVIAERLKLFRLIDVILQSPKQKDIVASVSIFDPAARGIAADGERETKRDAGKVSSVVSEAVENVIATQRTTAQLQIDISPADAKVKVVANQGTVRELTDAEVAGKMPVRLFLGGYTLHAEKPGFAPQNVAVTLLQTGATVKIDLAPSPVLVRFEWTPKDAIVRVDNQIVSTSTPEMDLSEGPHRLEVTAPPGQPYEPIVRDLHVRRNMEPVRLSLQRLTELRIKAPLGYSVSVDNRMVPKDLFATQGLWMSTTHKTGSGSHVVTAVSFRGLTVRKHIDVLPNSSTEVSLNPPPLWPGALLMSAGLLTIGGGVAAYLADGRCLDAPECFFETNYAPAGYTLMAIGGAAVISGIVWMAYHAASHPRYYRPISQTGSTGQVSFLPSRPARTTGILTVLEF